MKAVEVSYYLILAGDLGYGSPENLMSLLEAVSRLLYASAKALLTPDY